MIHTPCISIIIPVYNVAPYLHKCIKSVIDQYFKDIEILLINDGSTDGSDLICNHFATLDKRIQVIHQSNQGVGSARNQGIEHAKGEWICFIDSDDYLAPDYLSAFIEKGSLEKTCFNIQGWKCINHIEKITNIYHFPHLSFQVPQESIYVSTYHAFDNNAPWGKLFNRQIIQEQNLKFPTNLPVREDAVFAYTYRKYINYIHLIPETGYYYRLPERRITASHNNYHFQIYNNIKISLFPIVQEVLEKYNLHSTPYGLQKISYFKNTTFISAFKSLFAYPYTRKKRLQLLNELLNDCAYFYKPIIPNRLVQIIRLTYKLLPFPFFDFIWHLPLHIYYSKIKHVHYTFPTK